MRRLTCLLALGFVAGACGGGAGSPGAPPAPPVENDPAYVISKARSWLIVGNDLTPGHDTFEVEVTPPSGTKVIDLWINGGEGQRLAREGDVFRYSTAVTDWAPGLYEVLLAADGASTAFARLEVRRTHPLYVVVSTDWDDADNPDANLARHEDLHAAHPELLLTHFVGPYTFTDPAVTVERRAELASWAIGMRDTYGDEIGLHIHPYCNFVSTTTVPCRTMPSTVYPQGDDTGYTVIVASYTEEELTILLEASDALFEANGLGKPTSFRAGGWTAQIHTLKALANAGYVADTSALNWARIEEWENVGETQLYEWNKTHWSSINDTSQPYYPSENDILASAPPYVPVLEVPDNGALVDYVTGREMIDIFNANFGSGILSEPKAYSIGFHPPNFTESYKNRIHEALSHVDQFLISQDAGPVEYARLSDLALVWKLPQ